MFIDLSTGRILGMAPASVQIPLNTAGLRWKSELLLHAWEIESYLAKWRIQVKEEATIRTERQAARDAIFRNALASAIRLRNQSVNQYNRDENNRLLRKMDEDYDRKLKKQMNPVLHGVAEASDQSKSSLDISLDSPYFKHEPERLAAGDRVDPEEAKS